MIRNLIIDGRNYGQLEKYTRTDELYNAWCFVTKDENGKEDYTTIWAGNIRRWDTAGGPTHNDFDILTFSGSGRVMTEPKRGGTYKYTVAERDYKYAVKREKLTTKQANNGNARYSKERFRTMQEAYHAIQTIQDHPLSF